MIILHLVSRLWILEIEWRITKKSGARTYYNISLNAWGDGQIGSIGDCSTVVKSLVQIGQQRVHVGDTDGAKTVTNARAGLGIDGRQLAPIKGVGTVR